MRKYYYGIITFYYARAFLLFKVSNWYILKNAIAAVRTFIKRLNNLKEHIKP